jgi:hypothetical protein
MFSVSAYRLLPGLKSGNLVSDTNYFLTHLGYIEIRELRNNENLSLSVVSYRIDLALLHSLQRTGSQSQPNTWPGIFSHCSCYLACCSNSCAASNRSSDINRHPHALTQLHPNASLWPGPVGSGQ